MRNIYFTLVTTLFSLAVNFSGHAFESIRTVCRSKDSRYVVKVSGSQNNTAEVGVYRLEPEWILIASFSENYLPAFFQSGLSIFAIGETSHSLLKLHADPDLFGMKNAGEGLESWGGRLYLNPKVASLLQGQDSQPVESPVSIVCKTEI